MVGVFRGKGGAAQMKLELVIDLDRHHCPSDVPGCYIKHHVLALLQVRGLRWHPI